MLNNYYWKKFSTRALRPQKQTATQGRFFDCPTLVFYECPGAPGLREDQEKVGRRGVASKNVCLCVRNWQRIIRLGDVSGTTGSKQHLFQGTAGINRHDQHIPKLDKLYQINPAYGKEFGGTMVQWQFIYLWPHSNCWSNHCSSNLGNVQESKCACLWD